MKKLVIGIPHNGPIDPESQISIFNMSTYLFSKGYMVEPRYSEGTYLAVQRNELSLYAKNSNADILFVDSDMIFASNQVDYLLDSGKDIIGGLYFSRREPHFPVVMKLLDEKELKEASERDPKITMEDNEYFFKMELQEIEDKPFTRKNGLGIGTGFLYIKNQVLNEMWKDENIIKYGKPFSYWRMKNGEDIKEDLAFCLRANRLGMSVWCDPRTELIHLGKQKITKMTHIDYKYRDELYGNDIEGWMTFNELNWLYHNVKRKGIKDIVEIGSYKGRSTHAFLSATNGKVYAIDTWESSPEILEMYKRNNREYNAEETFNDFKYNVGKFNNLITIKNTSFGASKLIQQKEFDMVFIDGAHDYDSVKTDILTWNPRTKRLICGHDWGLFPGVEKAVREIFGNNFKTSESIWFVWKDEIKDGG